MNGNSFKDPGRSRFKKPHKLAFLQPCSVVLLHKNRATLKTKVDLTVKR